MSKKNIYFKRKRKSILSHRWFWDFVLVLIFLIGFSYLLLKTPYFEIKNIEVLGGEGEMPQEIQKIITNKNFFLLSSNNLSKEVKNIFPQVQKIIVKKNFPNSALVEIKEREEFGIFCPQSESSSCFSISDDGIIFKEAEKKNGAFLIFNSQANQPKLGDEVIGKDLMGDIAFLKEELEKSQITLAEIEILPRELRAKTGAGFLIYFSKEIPIETQIEVFLKTLQEIISAEEQKNLKYIDLRGLKDGQKGLIYFQ